MPDQRSAGHSRTVRRMFSELAPWYDLLNRVLSLGLDVIWRRRLVAGLPGWPSPTLLDLAAGTLDVTLELSRRYPQARVVAADFSLAMLRRGRDKWRRQQGDRPLALAAADAQALPLTSSSLDGLTLAFGLRNLASRSAALKEMYRVLKPGGRLAILEFGPPSGRWLAPLYRFYLTRLLPPLGRVCSRHPEAYQYLAATIQAFPGPEVIAGELRAAGFQASPPLPLTRGIVWIYQALKT